MKAIVLNVCLLLAVPFAHAGTTHLPGALSASTPDKPTPVVHNIPSDQLPAKLLTTIRKSYKSYWITSLYKETSNGKTSYHTTIENADQKVTLSAAPATGWTITKVIPKGE